MYDLDTNSYIRGGFTWDIYHNPFMNLFIAGLGRLWSNAWFIVSVQCLGFACGAAFLLETWFRPQGSAKAGSWYWAALLVIGLEPITTFYNYSLLAESFYTCFTLFSIGAAIHWLRQPNRAAAICLGIGLGFCFLCKLSAIIHLPLLGVFLLRWPESTAPLWRRFLTGPVRHGLFALAPFVACYVFVFLGQQRINSGDLYTVEGRVRWDFSSSQYQPNEVDAPLFKQFVHPYILEAGQLVAHRELRRELSYLGYKDCVAAYEDQGESHNRGVNVCDSLFGAVAAQVMGKYFWESEAQFVADNFRFIHTLSYIDYRFTPNLYYYHPDAEWHYLDSLMETHYHLNLADQAHRIPSIWTSLEFGNVYFPIVWWLWWLVIGASLWVWFRHRQRRDLLVLALFLTIPLLFHFVYISYRPRFLAPYLILELLLLLQVAAHWTGMKTKKVFD